MGSENSLWATFKKNMRVGVFDRHEDKLNLGVPDVSYVVGKGSTGWIELKHVHQEDLPKRVDTIFSIKHFTREQKFWLRRRGHAGDNCWVLLQVGRDYYLFDWNKAQRINTLTCVETTQLARHVWTNGMDWTEFHHILVKGI